MLDPPFRIKVCGIRDAAHVAVVAAAGGDAIGLNFYPASARYLTAAEAGPVAREALAAGVLPVGVFVNTPLEEILRTASAAGLSTVQLHGDETPDLAASLATEGIGVIRAVRLPAGPLDAADISASLDPWLRAGCSILLDADAGAAYGGRGLRLDWASLERWQRQSTSPTPFVLAGGLTVDSVASAILASQAWGVDVASGVETRRGIKSAEMIRDFISRADAALGTR